MILMISDKADNNDGDDHDDGGGDDDDDDDDIGQSHVGDGIYTDSSWCLLDCEQVRLTLFKRTVV